MRKGAIAVGLLGLVMLFFALGLHRQLTFDQLKESLGQLMAWRAAEPFRSALLFFVLYLLVTALSLPGAAIMTLAAGALFGLGWGFVIVSFASSLGATLAFMTARYLLHDAVQRRFGNRLQAINAGMARDGALYLFTLRLVPIFPFFIINLLMGLTPIGSWTFYWVSQLGMVAGTLVYVNAGTQLAQLTDLSGIFSPALLLSLALLGFFPLLSKRLLQTWQRRRVYARWRRPRRFDRNLLVIGGGAAGLVTAYIAATVKARVTLIEAHKMGGDCLNHGCVPSKALIEVARLAHAIRHAPRQGLVVGEPVVDFRRVMARVQAVIRQIEPHDSIERYTGLGVEVLEGRARLVDPWTVAVAMKQGGERRLTARSIVLATGAQPLVPPLPGLEEVGYLTSDTLWAQFATLDVLPGRIVVLGGGPIGCELAQSLARLGAEVTQIERSERILQQEDEEVALLLQDALGQEGVILLTGHLALRCERDGERKFIVVADAEQQTRRIEFDALICAVGRVARLTGYGLEELGIATDRRVQTNDYLETLYPNILAAGDLVGPWQFTHAAAHQAWYAAVNALFGQFWRFRVDHSVLPRATFVDPELARVGLNEQEARAQGVPYEVTRYELTELDRAIIDDKRRGFVKVLTVPGRDRILGVTIVCEQAAELIAEFVLAMQQGVGLNALLGTLHIYPTLAEANKYVAGQWRQAHAPQRLLAWAARYHRWRRGG